MRELCDLVVHINGQHTFFLNQKIMSTYSGKLKRMIKQEKNKKTHIKNLVIEVNDIPGGQDGFELVSRFCYNNGRIPITTSNLPLLHCSAIFLEMTDKISPYNLVQQTEIFLEGLFYWSWNDILMCLKNCESLFSSADSSGILEKLISSLISKITQNSDLNLLLPAASSFSSSSSPETNLTGFRFSSSNKTTPDHHSSITTAAKSSSSSRNPWWFDELSILPPKIIERVIMMMGAYKTDNSNSLILTKFILHYLKTAVHNNSCNGSCSKRSSSSSSSSSSFSEYSGLADAAVYGVALMGKKAFSCRGLFWVLRVVSDLGLSRSCQVGLEKLIGEMLEQATLDDLLVAGHSSRNGGVYDVNLVLRLIRAFVSSDDVTVMKLKRLGRVIDKYLGEISPDHNLKVSKFLAVADSLPDCARDCFDGVYRAIDIYLESHTTLSFQERSRICRCLNYEKLSLEACKDLAKNPRIPPKITIQALMSQKSKTQNKAVVAPLGTPPSPPSSSKAQMLADNDDKYSEFSEESEETKLHIQRMQCRVFELEKICKQMKGQMSSLIKDNKAITSPAHNRAAPKGPRLC